MENLNDNIFEVTPSIEVGQGEEESAVENEEEQVDETTPDEDGQVEESTDEETTEDETQEQPLILGKFKTEDDLKKAHNNLCRKIEAEMNLPYGSVKPVGDNLAEDYKDMEAYYTQLRQNKSQNVAPQNKEQPQDDETTFMNWFNEKVQEDPLTAYKELAKFEASKMFNAYKTQLDPIIQEKRNTEIIKSVASQYSDFNNYREAISEEIAHISKEEPQLMGTPYLLEKAYFRAKQRVLEEQAKTAFENGKKAAMEERNNKKKINNEINNNKNDGDSIPEGVTIIPSGDGIFNL